MQQSESLHQQQDVQIIQILSLRLRLHLLQNRVEKESVRLLSLFLKPEIYLEVVGV